MKDWFSGKLRKAATAAPIAATGVRDFDQKWQQVKRSREILNQVQHLIGRSE